MKLRLAVLDMIGTTVQAGDEVPWSFREAFRLFGLDLPPGAVEGVRGRSKSEAILALVAEFFPSEADPQRMAREVYSRFQDLLRDRYGRGASAVPGAASVLGWLREMGVATVLTTGLDRETGGRIVRGLGWDAVGLAGILTGEDVSQGRPAPELIHAAMRRVGEGDPLAVLAAGDTESDLMAAATAGVGWNVGVLTGAHSRERLERLPHSVILESLADLPHWLRERGVVGGDPA